MDNFVTSEIELTDEQLGAVFGGWGGSYDSYDYNQLAKNFQSNAATVNQLAAAEAVGGALIGGNNSGNAAAAATNLSSIGQSNSNTQKQWYYWY